MRKKLFAMYALVGALVASPVFTSCVDDSESTSVSALRGAKAEQLKAAAALANAQAAAETTLANAEAQFKAAEAAYWNAKAEAEKAAAENQKELTKQAQETYAIQLEVIKAIAERDLLSLQIEIAGYEETMSNQANDKLLALYRNYANAVNNTTYYQTEKIRLTNEIAQAEAGLVTAEEIAKNSIADYEKYIANQNKMIALYEKYEGADIEALEDAVREANIAYKKAQDAVRIKEDAKNKAYNAYWDARYVAIEYSNYDILSVNSIEEVSEKALATLKAVRTIRNLGFGGSVNQEEKVLTEESGYTYTYYTLNAEHAAANKLTLENRVKDAEDYLGKEAAGEEEATGRYANLANWEKQKADALEADENADVSWYDERIAYAKAEIADAKENLANQKADLDAFNAAVASFAGDDLAAYDKAIKDITDLLKAYDKAYAEYLAAFEAREDANTEWNAARNLANQNDVKQMIQNCKNNILYYQEQIQGIKNNIGDTEYQIEQQKVRLANIEAQLASYQAIADNYKAQIDALLAEGEEEA